MASASGSKDYRHRRSLRIPPSPAAITGVRETLDDWISQLPDSLLVQILSLLPTKEVFRTSILSKRWQYVWTSVYNFNFTSDIFNTLKLEEGKFDDFVDYVLCHSICSKIIKFELNTEWQSDSIVSRWLSFAVERKVEDVVLFFREHVSFPECLGTCSSLVTLDITCCEFHDDMAISWKSLKSIKLRYMTLSDEDFAKLLAGCPALETMELSQVHCFCRLDIKSLRLKRLYLEDLPVDEDESDSSMEIYAPYLQHFGVSGDLKNVKFRLLDVSSLVSANFTFTNYCCDWYEGDCQNEHQVFNNLVLYNLQKLSFTTELTLGSWFTEVLCMLQLQGVPIPELKCKYLTLELHAEEFNLYGAAGILRAFPHVETLNIDMSKDFVRYRRCNFESGCLVEGDNIDLPTWISNFGFPNLKNVKLVISFGFCSIDFSKFMAFSPSVDKLFKLSEFVLKNATILEKFVISTEKKCKMCLMNCVSPCLSDLAKTLLDFPRASSKCVINFQE